MKKAPLQKKQVTGSGEAFAVRGLHVSVGDTPIIRGVNLAIRPGEIHILMGSNGSGKSTLLNAILGSPRSKVTKGSIHLGRKNLTAMPVYERARAGLFLGFQEPVEIPGVNIGSFLRTAKNTINEQTSDAHHLTPMEFSVMLKDGLAMLGFDERFGGRALNDGFSGGEKKKNELLQMVILQPRFAFLDEFDSGLDVDAFKIAVAAIATLADRHKTGFLLVSHNPHIADIVTPTGVHIMAGGRIVKSGGANLLNEIEKHGYEQFSM